MRNAAVSRFLILIIAIATFGSLADSASAGTKKLQGTYNHDTVEADCVAASGTLTKGTGPGGYGCTTSKGSVSCDAKGNCTGTCKSCSAARVIKSHELETVLHGGKVVTKATHGAAPHHGKPPSDTVNPSGETAATN